jgi:integrase/recombinase XerC
MSDHLPINTYPLETEPESPTTQIIPAEQNSETNFYLLQDKMKDEGNTIQEELLDAIIESYIRYYATGKGHTARAKRYDLENFALFLRITHKPDSQLKLKDWTLQSTKNFVDYLLDKGESPSTVARRLATIKHFGRTLGDRVPGFINPAREVKAPVYEVSKPQGLTDIEVSLLMDAANHFTQKDPNSFQHLRNRTIIEFLLGTGLRADEIRYLKRGQVSDDCCWIKNVKTKGKRFREVYVHDRLSLLLDEYLQRCKSEITIKFPGSLSWNQNEWTQVPVFVSTHRASLIKPESFSLAPKTLWRIISDIGKKASEYSSEDMPHLHPHKLRHTFAHGLLTASNDIRLVAQALGHSDVRTTMRYTERSKEELAKAIEKQVSIQNNDK